MTMKMSSGLSQKGYNVKYQITEQVLNAIANYLSTRPYREVAQLINALAQAEKIEPAAMKAD